MPSFKNYLPPPRSSFKNKYLYYGLGVVLVLVLIKWFYAGDSLQNKYELPSAITFAGQKIPLEDQKTYERIDTAFQIYVHDQRGQINLWLKRLDKYQEIIIPILEKNNIHPDLIYLAVKESSLLPCPSSSANARGFWQFIPETATRFNLKITDYVDERCDIFKSTEAAGKYLQLLLSSKYFNGDIFAAMAAYNDGEGDVLNMLKAQGNFGNNLGYFSSLTNQETDRYIPGIIALKIVLENPEQYGFFAPDEYPPWRVEKFMLQPIDDIEITTLAAMAELDFLDFINFNPHFRITYTTANLLPKESSYNIYLPAENMKKLKDFLAKAENN
jgi:hypothetical protein